MSVIHMTRNLFEEKISNFDKFHYKGDNPVIIDFYAEWCGPCKMVSPILEELSQEYNNIDFYKIDVEEEESLAALIGVESVPFLVFIPANGTPQFVQGAIPKDKFKELFNSIFNIGG